MNIFYKTENLYERLPEFIEDVKQLSHDHKIEQKYVEGRWREPSDKSLEFITDSIIGPEELRLIRREPVFDFQVPELEAVFLYLPREWYLATFYIDVKHEKYFVAKYDLGRLK